MNANELQEIINAHQRWLNNDPGGTQANLSEADLSEADLKWANLSRADLSEANLSGAIGLQKPTEWLIPLVQSDGSVLCYKAQRGERQYWNDQWDWKPGAFLEEVVNPLPTLNCACGVNVAASLEWLKENYANDTYWRCRISGLDIAGIVVPYNTDGKFRAGRVELLEIVE